VPTNPYAVAANKLRKWFRRRLDSDALEIARLYRASRDTLVERLRYIYQNFLPEPTLVAARSGPSSGYITQAIDETVNRLTTEFGRMAVNKLVEMREFGHPEIRTAIPAGETLRDLPPQSRYVLNDLTTTVVGGGTFFDRMDHITRDLQRKVEGSIRQSLLNGETFDEVRNRVHVDFGVDRLPAPQGSAYGSVRIYRNEAQRQWNLLMQEMGGEAGGISVWWAMVGDPDTTPGCLARHGWRIDEDLDGEMPPRHINCRCEIAIFEPGTDLTIFQEEATAELAEMGYSPEEAEDTEESWARVAMRRWKRFVEAVDFDPAKHPRGEHGQFAPSGIEVTVTGGAPSLEDIERQRSERLERLRGIGRQLGYPEDKFTVFEEQKDFEVAGHHFSEGGHAVLETGEIAIRSTELERPLTERGEAVQVGMVAHEVEHQKFHSFLVRAEYERSLALQEDKVAIEKHGRIMAHRDEPRHYWIGGEEKIEQPPPREERSPLNQAGFLTEDGKKKYPAFAVREKYMEGDGGDKLQKDDGFNDYSTAWWERSKQPGVYGGYQSAIHESLAEIARYEAQAPPKPGGVLPEKPISKNWMAMYRAVNKQYDRIKRLKLDPRFKEAFQELPDKIVVYLDDQWRPTTPERAKIIKEIGVGYVRFLFRNESLREAWDPSVHPRGEHGRWSSTGALGLHEKSLPTTNREAARLIVENLLSQKEREGHDPKFYTDPKYQEKVRGNWSRGLKDRMGVREDFRVGVQEGMEYNQRSDNYMAAVNKYGGNAVVAALDDGTAVKQAEFQGTTFVYQGAFNTEKDVEDKRTRLDQVPEPGTILADGSFGGTIRHEYGHRIYDAWRVEDIDAHDAWRKGGEVGPDPIRGLHGEFHDLLSNVPNVKDEISHYAGSKWEDVRNPGEAFAETFALWSHPRLDRSKFSAPVNRLFEFFDREFKR